MKRKDIFVPSNMWYTSDIIIIIIMRHVMFYIWLRNNSSSFQIKVGSFSLFFLIIIIVTN